MDLLANYIQDDPGTTQLVVLLIKCGFLAEAFLFAPAGFIGEHALFGALGRAAVLTAEFFPKRLLRRRLIALLLGDFLE